MCPDIPAQHRPDFLYLREPTKKGNIQRRAFDTPQINIVDLSEEDALIAFVISRGQNHPGEFTMLDAENGSLNPSSVHFNAVMWNFFMVMSGQNEEEDYGKIRHLNELKAEGKEHLGEIPPIGLYTLQIQASILMFLEKCCHKLLPELEHVSIEERSTAFTPAQKLNNGGWLSTRFLTPNPDYLSPGAMRLAELTFLAEGRFLAAEDHICSLIVDPEYLLEAISVTGKHYPRIDLDLLAWAEWMVEGFEQGKTHKAYVKILTKRIGPGLKALLSSTKKKAATTAADRLFWAKVSNWVIGDAHLQLLFWIKISNLLHTIKDLLFTCKVDANATRLPPKIENAFRHLWHIVTMMKDLSYGTLGMGLPVSKELRHLYQKGRETRADRASIKTAVLTGKRMKTAEYRVHHTLRAMYCHGDSMHSEYAFQDEVRHMMKTDSAAAELISEWNADQILNISSSLTILRELDNFQPWVQGWRHMATFDRFEDDNVAMLEDMMNIKNAAIACGHQHPILPDIPSMQYASGSAFSKQRENIEQVSGQYIHSFYNYLAEAMGGKNPFVSDLERLMRRLGVDSTKGAHSELAQAMANMALSAPPSGSTDGSSPTYDNPGPSTGTEPQDDDNGDEEEIQPIEVTERGAQVFRIIAGLQPEDKTTELAFEDFRFAMEELGFEAFEMCWPGWLFYPKEGSRMVRPLFCRAPHANGGKWTAKQIRLIRARFLTLSGMYI